MSEEPKQTSSEPLDLIRLLLDEQVYVKLRGARELTGKLQVIQYKLMYDLTNKISKQSTTKKSEVLFIRGDSVILVSSPSDD
ncbi:unnamed protein product [Wickerhamomyces anomalus]